MEVNDPRQGLTLEKISMLANLLPHVLTNDMGKPERSLSKNSIPESINGFALLDRLF